MIEVQQLSKHYGDVIAVADVSFRVQPGRVTGFVGPNGAGKSTTMRMILGLDRPTSGTVLVEGRPYRLLAAPLRYIGALLDAAAAAVILQDYLDNQADARRRTNQFPEDVDL